MTQAKSGDPFQMWRDWVSQSERQWNALMNDVMASDQFTKQLGQFMDVYLNMSRTLNETMGRYLSAINMPTRQDVLALGDRLAAIEERLGAIEQVLRSSTASAPPGDAPASSARPMPPRTRKPLAAQE